MARIISLLSIISLLTFSSGINAQELTMFTGFFNSEVYQDDKKITKDMASELMKSNSEVHTLWTTAQKHQTASFVFLASEIGFLFWQISAAKNRESQTMPLVGLVGSGIASLAFAVSSRTAAKEAILKYNADFDKPVSIRFGAANNGIGFTMSF